jgi:hypothetical protein
MNNFELIDDYLSNRLKGADREAFEKQLNNDPALRSDLDFQNQIVVGIRTARATELKAMLSKVPVGGTTIAVDFSVLKMAAGLIAAGAIGAAIYFFATKGELPPFNKAAGDLNSNTKTEEVKTEPKQEATPDSQPETSTPAVVTPEEKKEEKKTEKVIPAQKPKLEVADPSEELENNDNAKKDDPTALRRSEIIPSNIQVEVVEATAKKYDFHYQFAGSKLMLYGSFDKSLYEVLEINGDNHAVFLFYKDFYYLLNEKQDKITKLEPITDAALVSKLRDYRKR